MQSKIEIFKDFTNDLNMIEISLQNINMITFINIKDNITFSRDEQSLYKALRVTVVKPGIKRTVNLTQS